jgi:hypothetical protein
MRGSDGPASPRLGVAFCIRSLLLLVGWLSSFMSCFDSLLHFCHEPDRIEKQVGALVQLVHPKIWSRHLFTLPNRTRGIEQVDIPGNRINKLQVTCNQPAQNLFAIPVLVDPFLLKKRFLSDSSVHIIGCQHGNPDQIAPQPRGFPSLKDFLHDTRTKQTGRSGWGDQGNQSNRIRVG